ncbi:MAG: Na+/H+ antiporter subunit E [Hyphomicrobiaceae bacterium]|nr:Na+/H+ antiporter subunit E [Hyphomicrobiaceae bacterium]MCC0022792.1 Na+/H+ antiporter subunit E [Hyphomicrobiaceae bacterium]
MSQASDSLKLFATLLVAWILLSGSIAFDVVAVGVAAALFITLISQNSLSAFSGLRALPQSFGASLGYVGFFLSELVRANLRMAKIVLDPALPIRPAIVRARTELTHPVARLLLANSITLTPGTLSVEIKDEWLYVHWVVAEGTDNETATREIVEGFERYLKVMYG